MLALMIPHEGMPFFSSVPDTFRGGFVTIAVQQGQSMNYESVAFKWIGEYRRSRLRHDAHLFDVFEQVEQSAIQRMATDARIVSAFVQDQIVISGVGNAAQNARVAESMRRLLTFVGEGPAEGVDLDKVF